VSHHALVGERERAAAHSKSVSPCALLKISAKGKALGGGTASNSNSIAHTSSAPKDAMTMTDESAIPDWLPPPPIWPQWMPNALWNGGLVPPASAEVPARIAFRLGGGTERRVDRAAEPALESKQLPLVGVDSLRAGRRWP
jgi:hypothetical protein